MYVLTNWWNDIGWSRIIFDNGIQKIQKIEIEKIFIFFDICLDSFLSIIKNSINWNSSNKYILPNEMK